MDLDPEAVMLPLDYPSLVPPALLDPPPVAVLPGTVSRLEIPYAHVLGWRPLRLDLHLPATPQPGGTPLVAYVHGGSFLAGMPTMGSWKTLPARGIAVASLSYRFAGESQFPGPVEDVRAAMRWIADNAARFGVDSSRLSMWGSSAGAYLAAVAAVSGSQDIGQRVGTSKAAFRISAVVCHYGVFDPLRLREDARHSTPAEITALESVMAAFFGTPDTDPAVINLAGPDPLPPFLLMHGDSDRRVGLGQSSRFADALTDRGVPCELVVIAGADHGSAEFESAANVALVERFLRRTWARGEAIARPGAAEPTAVFPTSAESEVGS